MQEGFTIEKRDGDLQHVAYMICSRTLMPLMDACLHADDSSQALPSPGRGLRRGPHAAGHPDGRPADGLAPQKGPAPGATPGPCLPGPVHLQVLPWDLLCRCHCFEGRWPSWMCQHLWGLRICLGTSKHDHGCPVASSCAPICRSKGFPSRCTDSWGGCADRAATSAPACTRASAAGGRTCAGRPAPSAPWTWAATCRCAPSPRCASGA